jgi:hypothetical protein
MSSVETNWNIWKHEKDPTNDHQGFQWTHGSWWTLINPGSWWTGRWLVTTCYTSMFIICREKSATTGGFPNCQRSPQKEWTKPIHTSCQCVCVCPTPIMGCLIYISNSYGMDQNRDYFEVDFTTIFLMFGHSPSSNTIENHWTSLITVQHPEKDHYRHHETSLTITLNHYTASHIFTRAIHVISSQLVLRPRSSTPKVGLGGDDS